MTRSQTLRLSAFAIGFAFGCTTSGGSTSSAITLSCGPLEYISGNRCLPLEIADGSAISIAVAADASGDAPTDSIEDAMAGDAFDGGDVAMPDTDSPGAFDGAAE